MCVPLTRNGGTVLVYGVTRAEETVSFHPFDVFRREILQHVAEAARIAVHRPDARRLEQLRKGALDHLAVLRLTRSLNLLDQGIVTERAFFN